MPVGWQRRATVSSATETGHDAVWGTSSQHGRKRTARLGKLKTFRHEAAIGMRQKENRDGAPVSE